MLNNDKNKQKGIVGTLLFHFLIFLCFIFMGLTYTTPPPPEKGITINFGINEILSKNVKTENAIKKNLVKNEISKEIVEKKILNQEIEETISIKEEVKEEVKEEIKEKVKEEINIKALYKGKNKKNAINTGNKEDKEGNAGSINGKTNGKQGNNGNINLGNRVVTNLVKPKYKSQVEGIVVVTIRVNKYGKVISAIPGAKGSTTTNKYLYSKAKEAALQTTFESKDNSPEIQIGTISYNFQLQ
tara:strand:+ start:412 stop:1140 length:729 start_codon:yes stop_codon:yes gene_type:complete